MSTHNLCLNTNGHATPIGTTQKSDNTLEALLPQDPTYVDMQVRNFTCMHQLLLLGWYFGCVFAGSAQTDSFCMVYHHS
jgi:hypothetical protein